MGVSPERTYTAIRAIRVGFSHRTLSCPNGLAAYNTADIKATGTYHNPQMNTKQLGDETEVKILADLISRGFSVSIPFGDNDPYDLVVDTGVELYRVQVKTARLFDEGVLRFNTFSKTTEDGEYVDKNYTSTELDAYAVRYPEDGTHYWVPIEDASKHKMTLRITEPKIDHPSVNLAEEYRFKNNLP